LTEPVHSGLFFSLLFSNPPLPLFHPFVTSHYPIWLAQLCVRVCVYMRFISWATATPQSTADRPANWTCPLLSLSPFLFFVIFEKSNWK
jgi:hypothetical protein